MAIALYARKSIERENSISCETQIEYCKSVIKPDERSEKTIEFIDNGYSGGNVDRDGFSITGFAANGINATLYRVDMGIIFDGDARIDHIARIVEITFISYRSTVLAGSVFNGGIALNDDRRA